MTEDTISFTYAEVELIRRALGHVAGELAAIKLVNDRLLGTDRPLDASDHKLINDLIA